jgi:hypothetical protein
MDSLSRVYLTSHGSRRLPGPLVSDGRSQFLVHTGKRTCAPVHFCFGVSYTKLLSSHMRHPPDSNPGALARAPIHEQALNRVSHRGAQSTGANNYAAVQTK